MPNDFLTVTSDIVIVLQHTTEIIEELVKREIVGFGEMGIGQVKFGKWKSDTAS